MKKQIIVLAFIAIAASMTACQWPTVKKETKSTDSTAVIADSVEIAMDSVATDSVK